MFLAAVASSEYRFDCSFLGADIASLLKESSVRVCAKPSMKVIKINANNNELNLVACMVVILNL
jgi:hypothetical protein